MKAFNEMCPIDEKSLYMSLLFGVATIIYLGICLYQKTWPNWWEVFYGTLIGICNVAGSWALLIALDQVSALIAFSDVKFRRRIIHDVRGDGVPP